MAEAVLRVGIDVGGTFTDLVASDVRSGERYVIKAPTTPEAPERGVLSALDLLFAKFADAPRIEYLAHSTTIATNALLGQMQLELPRVALITTFGFRDVIEIGRQNRSEVYNLFVQRPRMLVAKNDRITVRERMLADGSVLIPLEESEIARALDLLCERRVDAVAIGFLHAYANDAHEVRMARAVAQAFPELPVTYSSEIDPEYREYERFSTTVVNAALMPIVTRYLGRLREALVQRGIDAPLYVMQSNGGMSAASHVTRRPATIIESGPASGIIAAAHLARDRAATHVLAFDMGGTTAKAGTIVDGAVQVVSEFEAAGSTHSGRSIKGSGYPVRFPFVDLAEVSAGGGTIAWVDETDALRIGPLSAGADPGPACYGKSDAATVTDANVVLGRLNQTHLVGGTFAIDAQRSRDAIERLAARIGLSPEEAAAGIIRIVDAQMAKVLRIVTMERGLDPRDFVLVAFGGNGALHACSLADELGIAEVIVPRHPGVFSAEGLIVADLRSTQLAAVLRSLDEGLFEELTEMRTQLAQRAHAQLREQGASEIRFAHSYDARYRGQSFELEIEHQASVPDLMESFHAKHETRYGYRAPDEPIEIVNVRVHAVAPLASEGGALTARAGSGAAREARAVWIDGARVQVPVYERVELQTAQQIDGPALIEQYDTVTFVPRGWYACNDSTALRLRRSGDQG